MKKVFVSFLLLALWLVLDRPGVWAVDVGWMQQGVRVWYFGAASTGFSSDAEEAYLFNAVNGNNATLTHHSGINHWVTTNAPSTATYAVFETNAPCWIHPQTLQILKIDDFWQGQRITNVLRAPYTYDTFIHEVSPDGSIPYLLLPIKTLFDLSPQRNLVKIVYQIDYTSTGIAYFDTDTGLLLLRENSTGFVTVFFILSEINYDFANHTAFAEDNGPHTGFRSNVIKTKSELYATHMLQILSSVESRYGNTVQMWTSTQAGGASGSYLPVNENYCFFGNVPVLRHKLMTATPNYPPENWNAYGEYLWWWLPAGALADSTINIFGVPMTRTSTAPYTFSAAGTKTSLYFSDLIFDNDGYMTDFSAKDPSIGLNIGLGPSGSPVPSASPDVPIHLVDGLAYYKATMGRAVPVEIYRSLTMTVLSDTADKGGGSVNGDGDISCNGHGSSPSGMSGKCQADFLAGSTANLTQSPDSDSVWATWSVAGCGTNQSCQVLMTGDRNVTVTFPYTPKAKVKSTNYRCDSLALAYGNAAALDTIYGRAVTFTENFTLSGSKAVTLLGGRDAWYQPLNAWTTLLGTLAIRGGSLTVENLIIR
jgi:hypothetical protein